ncbi:hypothetical protein BGW36DRAFT_79204 [Talaromyces proteolyticus]|uniref:Uncharacterized protein n=1 Tax=Talaromyces proteolyticus TaxID=1131652 RepID=A0AAD4KE83_9EURO|nr:uncharacterized protein BGW36DRAFT_79204 [Talaromyces proteolyticus]KAH8688722.1 hypothetical protein BGW36DRAFT_79204 [Talaromyces proteolyticus]
MSKMSLQNPTHAFWISAYHGFSKSIPILDLTQKILPEYVNHNRDIDDSKFRTRLHDIVMPAQESGEDECEDLRYILKKDTWKSRIYLLFSVGPTEPHDSMTAASEPADLINHNEIDDPKKENSNSDRVIEYCIATVQRTSHLTLSFLIQFPNDSTHSSHAVECKRGKMVPRTQVFVKDSIQYSWEMESGIKDFRQTLFRNHSGQKTAVAVFRRLEHLRGLRGKLLLVDETAGIDHVVVLLSTLATYKGGGG